MKACMLRMLRLRIGSGARVRRRQVCATSGRGDGRRGAATDAREGGRRRRTTGDDVAWMDTYTDDDLRTG